MSKQKCPLCSHEYKEIYGFREIWFNCHFCKKTKEEIDKIMLIRINESKIGVSVATGIDLSEDDIPNRINHDAEWGLC